MFRLFSIALILFVSFNAAAQARRVPQPRPAPTAATNGEAATRSNPAASTSPQASPAALFEDANTYAKRKFEEFERKQVPYTQVLRETTFREQKQLAAKFAAQLSTQALTGEDFYFLGMLHLLADNNDGATEAMKKFLAITEKDAEKAQTARSIVAVSAARRRNFEESEAALKEYLKTEPVRVRERVSIERELARSYFEVKNYERAAFHAEAALLTAKPMLGDPTVNARLTDEVFDVGIRLFEIHARTGNTRKAEAVLEDLRETAVFVNSARLYSAATDKLITFLIDVKRKPEALQKLKTTEDSLGAKFKDQNSRLRVLSFLKKREPQYRLLGEAAPELAIDRWVGNKQTALANSRGKVVLLDFWATWCVPCYAAFPELTEWHETYGGKGLEIVGLTRYYGTAEGLPADNEHEIQYLQKFKREQRLPYSFAVAKGVSNHNRYTADNLPTMVLIDKKGVIRYVQTGVGQETEVQEMIEKLLAEN
ncbi:MAG TPA: TlpA disulfide reductase family protein [Pyrinomonadaceae bacterium]|nr:TlpA disulfide reductase family protein [Pyrinomonadaceae bacterium]